MTLSKNTIIAMVVVVVLVVAAAAAAITLTNDDDKDKKDSSYDNGDIKVTTYVDYNGNTAELTFSEIPERVVCGCNTALNLLLYLGLGDRIVGVYYNEEPIWDEVQSEYDKLVERIGAVDATGSKNISTNIQTSVLLSWEPDLVIGWVSWTDSGLGSEEFFNDNDCNVMSLNTMTSSKLRTTAFMKVDFDNIGKIFDVSEKTTQLYNDIIDVINTVTSKLVGKSTLYYALVDGSVNTEKGTVWCYKNSNFIASVLNSMGFTNAFPDGGTVNLASVYEVIGTTNIDMIIYITYGSVTYENSLNSWKADSDLSQCKAIQNGYTMEMLLSCSYGSTPQLLDAVNDVYEFVEKIYA